MFIILQYIIDFVFPPSKEELIIRNISPIELSNSSSILLETEFPFIKSLFSYKNPIIKELIWQIKYKKNKHAIKCAGYCLFEKLKEYSKEKIILIPIPISNQRRKERGYNQTELLIDEIIKLDLNNNFEKDYNILVRTKNIDKQTHKNRNDRIENTKSIFQVKERRVSNNKIIIIDDVTTTGSTLNEARKCLMDSEYSDIQALTIAH